MIKVSFFPSESECGRAVVPLFGPADSYFEKVAAPTLVSDVVRYIETLRPQNDSQYMLVNALGAGEYFGSNINADHFPEAGLIHSPDDWAGNPLIDKAKYKDWPYGFPTFYQAFPYSHHRNKHPERAFGEVELVAWNDYMKRVELVMRLDKSKCFQFGGVPVWDKIKAGQFPDVSMGCLPAGSLITMADGTQKPIELVRETEWVLTHTGAHRRVTDTMRRHHPGSVFRFKVYGFRRELVVTGNHPLWLVDGDQLQCDPQPRTVNKGRKQRHCTPFVKASSKGCSGCGAEPDYTFEWRRADEAQIGDYLAFPVPKLRTSGALEGNRSLARLLGYYLAEGHVSNYNNRPKEQVNFSLSYEERELAAEIEHLARALGVTVLWHHETPECGARIVSIVSKRLASLCSSLCGDGAKTKVLAKEVLHEDPEILLELLGAYLNGDGGTYKGSAYFSTASEQLAHQLFIALARCGLVASVNKNEHKPSEKSVVKKETTEYQVWVGTDFAWKLEPYISKPVRKSLKVRGQRFFYEKEGVTYLMAPIVEIDESPHNADVFNFSVEEDESYVAEGLAVHNSKVPFDTCSICLDTHLYQEALQQFNPKRHKHPGFAVLEFHKDLQSRYGQGIRGLSITRADYCEHMRRMPNRILPDGRKVFVYNDFPRFFDISVVFIGADKTAKSMMKIAEGSQLFWFVGPSVEVAEKLGYVEDAFEKTASLGDSLLKISFLGKDASHFKQSEIEKEVIPSQFAGKAVPLLTREEKDLPADVLEELAQHPFPDSLSTAGKVGIVIKPKEFQRIILIQLNKRSLADELDARDEVFPEMEEKEPVGLEKARFVSSLLSALAPLLTARSGFAPYVEKRVVMLSSTPESRKTSSASHPPELLRKIGAAYNGYRDELMNVIVTAQATLQSSTDKELQKVASAPVGKLFSPLSYAYFKTAYLEGTSTN